MIDRHPYTPTCCACRCMSEILGAEGYEGFVSKVRIMDVYDQQHEEHEADVAMNVRLGKRYEKHVKSYE